MRALLIGPWKNVEELEESLSLPELIAFLKADSEREYTRHKFMAALKGLNLDESQENQSSFEEVQRRAQARIAGVNEEEFDLADFGIDYEG